MSTEIALAVQIRAATFVAEVECHQTLTSTNDRAIQCAAEPGHKLPLLVVAEHQTAGRGRGSNRWWTGPGGLAFSLLLAAEQVAAAEPRHKSLIALAAGLAVAETIVPLAVGRSVGIHWPNDVMADGRKLAGILIEVLSDGRYIVGIGVNTNNTSADAPAELRPLVATLRDLTGQAHDSIAILASILQHLERRLAQLACAPEQLVADADARCLQRGQQLTIRQGDQMIAGLCTGIGPDGGLVLKTPEGDRTIRSGVVCRE